MLCSPLINTEEMKKVMMAAYFPNPAKPEPTRGLGIPPQRAMIKTA
jgi:hypothetical protein